MEMGPARYGDQGLWTWKPSIVPGRAAVWYAGSMVGPMYYADPANDPTPILPTEQTVSAVSMALGPDGAHHLVFSAKTASTTVVRYAVGMQ